MSDPWIRNGVVVRVLDGDSLIVDVDLGYRVYHQTRIRLLGVDTPERGEDGWAEARDNLKDLVPTGAKVVVHSIGPDKYGDRWLAAVKRLDGTDLSTVQLQGGFGVPYSGGAR